MYCENFEIFIAQSLRSVSSIMRIDETGVAALPKKPDRKEIEMKYAVLNDIAKRTDVTASETNPIMTNIRLFPSLSERFPQTISPSIEAIDETTT